MKKLFYDDKFILSIILINVAVIYLHTFSSLVEFYWIFDGIDVIFTLFFLLEISTKILDTPSKKKLPTFLKNNWNKIDFFSLLLALPSVGILLTRDLEIFAGFTALRSLRVFKFLRIIEYIPQGKEISKQMFKAFRSIAFIVFAFAIYSTIISLISVSLFKSSSPTYFQNAFDAFFTIFKIFSGDGFSDVVGEIEQHRSGGFIYFTKFYFVFIVFTGSILGLSLINSIFMNQMSQVEEQIEDTEKDILKTLKKEIDELKKQNEAIINEIKNKKE
jgi:voltage-gated sodium channel